ncbi:MAG: 4Fe-4S binding protein [Desulfomicrobium sp.]
MYPDHTQTIVFSPTGTTRNVLRSVQEGLGARSWSELDLTRRAASQEPTDPESDTGGVAIIGLPVYAGRIPELAAKRLSRVQGMGRKAVLVVVYGNRAYDDALRELRDLSLELGFLPVAAAAFVGEHSFSTMECPIAEGRPDQSDLKLAFQFGENVREKLLEIQNRELNAMQLEVPGNFPYREGMQPAPISPETDPAQCVLCGACIEACPVEAISLRGETLETDKMLCLRCCACTRICPTGARAMLHPRILELGRVLHEKHALRREPEFFFVGETLTGEKP